MSYVIEKVEAGLGVLLHFDNHKVLRFPITNAGISILPDSLEELMEREVKDSATVRYIVGKPLPLMVMLGMVSESELQPALFEARVGSANFKGEGYTQYILTADLGDDLLIAFSPKDSWEEQTANLEEASLATMKVSKAEYAQFVAELKLAMVSNTDSVSVN